MLESTGCRRLITQSSMTSLIADVESRMHAKGFLLTVDELPSLPLAYPHLFGEQDHQVRCEPYPPLSAASNLDELCIFIHSSGSTGFPKPIPIKHKMTLQFCRSGN